MAKYQRLKPSTVRIQSTIGWGLLVLVSMVVFWSNYPKKLPSLRLDDSALLTTVDVVIHQLTVQQFDEHGKLSHYLHTPLLQHIPEHNTHILQDPYIRVIQSEKPAWDIHAKQGIALYNGKEITLQHQVVLQQQSSEHSSEKRLTTDKITYFPEKKLAVTQQKIQFQDAESRIESMGMQADLNENRVKLLSDARGVYGSQQG